MAFTGTPTIKQISDGIVRITGLSLAAGASGTIALAGHTGATPDVVLPTSFQTKHYTYGGVNVPFADSIEITAMPAAVGVATSVPTAVVKSGTSTADFRGTLTNTHASLTTPNLEIMVKYHE